MLALRSQALHVTLMSVSLKNLLTHMRAIYYEPSSLNSIMQTLR